MCFTIVGKRTKAHAKFKRQRIAYKAVRRTMRGCWSNLGPPYINAIQFRGRTLYDLGVEVRLPSLSASHLETTVNGQGEESAAGLYVYRTYTQAWRDACRYSLIVIAVKVKPSDLLHVSKSGNIATYRALTPVREYGRNGLIRLRV